MTDAEKLKALIEMAWENGYPKWLRREYYPAISTAVNGEEYVDYEAEHTLFDHDFVKALCRGKYGSDWNAMMVDLPDRRAHAHYMKLQDWRAPDYHLAMLARSSDRIGYLAAEFLPPPPKS